jgi:hypothetical protein
MIDHLLAELGEKLDLTAEELADVIWLTLIRREVSLTEVLEPKSDAATIVKPDRVSAPVPSLPLSPAPSAQRLLSQLLVLFPIDPQQPTPS